MDFGNNCFRLFPLALGSVALALLAAYVIFAASSEKPELFVVDAVCELRSSPCRATTQNGKSIEFSIAPEGIPLLQPLDVSVRLVGVNASSVEVIFSGVDVDMGTLVYPLTAEGEHHFRGGASLSVCSQRKMRWKAMVVMVAEGRSYSVPFLFDTEYRPQFNFI